MCDIYNVQVNLDPYSETFTYNSSGNLITATDAAKSGTNVTTNGNNEVTQITLPKNTSGSPYLIQNTYDDNGDSNDVVHRLISSSVSAPQAPNTDWQTVNNSIVTTYTYNTFGQVIKTSTSGTARSGSSKLVSQNQYSTNGNYIEKTTDSLGNFATYWYNGNGLLGASRDANGQTAGGASAYTYDTGRRLTSAKVRDDTGDGTTVTGTLAQTDYAYTGGVLTGITHKSATDVMYSFTRDLFGNLTQTKVGTQALVTNTYAANNGNLTGTTYGNGQTVAYTYDSLDRVTRMAYSNGGTFDWYYNNRGQVAHTWNSVTGHMWDYTYDLAGRVSEATRSNSGDLFYFKWSYDSHSLPSWFVIRQNGALKLTQQNFFVQADALSKTEFTFAGRTGVYASGHYSYDYLGRVIKRQAIQGSGASRLGLATNFSYQEGASGSGQTSLRVEATNFYKISGTTETMLPGQRLTYTYDANGNIKTVSKSTVLQETYTYDKLNQLVRHDSVPQNKSIVYAYDMGGNILSKTEYAYTLGTLGTATATVPYTYGDSNWRDKLTAYNGTAITYDAIGNPLSYNGMTFTWKCGKQLATAVKSGVTTTYIYDAAGMRTQKTVGGAVTKYLYSGSQLLLVDT
ncbi:MAG: RHS repeat protein, partial [Oscillospiraceae bacterium]|nr:RHS repeat protein [Oscillospiraceae bacterium]